MGKRSEANRAELVRSAAAGARALRRRFVLKVFDGRSGELVREDRFFTLTGAERTAEADRAAGNGTRIEVRR